MLGWMTARVYRVDLRTFCTRRSNSANVTILRRLTETDYKARLERLNKFYVNEHLKRRRDEYWLICYAIITNKRRQILPK